MPPSNALSVPKLVLPGAALLLLISSFLPWYHVSVTGFGSANASGWHDFGPVVFVLSIALVGVAAAHALGLLPLDAAKGDLAVVALAGLTLACGLLFVILRFAGAGDPSDTFGLSVSASPGWGLYIGLIALIGIGAGAFLTLQSGGAKSAFEDLRNQAQQNQGGGTPPPPPPPAV